VNIQVPGKGKPAERADSRQGLEHLSEAAAASQVKAEGIETSVEGMGMSIGKARVYPCPVEIDSLSVQVCGNLPGPAIEPENGAILLEEGGVMVVRGFHGTEAGIGK
jgi:hypothetical protein